MSEVDIDKLISLAKSSSLNAYSPYSKFPVGCALISKKGQIFTGCNIENISFGLTICAERTAVFNAISQSGPDLEIEKVVIYTPTDLPITPCGACRQVLREFGDDFEVISVSKNNKASVTTITDLLPQSPAIKFDRTDD